MVDRRRWSYYIRIIRTYMFAIRQAKRRSNHIAVTSPQHGPLPKKNKQTVSRGVWMCSVCVSCLRINPSISPDPEVCPRVDHGGLGLPLLRVEVEALYAAQDVVLPPILGEAPDAKHVRSGG